MNRILWACGEPFFKGIKQEFTDSIEKSKEYEMTEKYNLSGVHNILSKEQFDFVFMYERLMPNYQITAREFEKLIDDHEKTRFIIVIQSLHESGTYANDLYTRGIYDIIFDNDLTLKKINKILKVSTRKADARKYLGLDKKYTELSVDDELVAKVLHQLNQEDEVKNKIGILERYVLSYGEDNILKIIKKLPGKKVKELTDMPLVASYVESVEPDKKGSNVITKEVQVVNTITEKEYVPVGYRKLILTVINNVEFAMELAYITAKESGFSTAVLNMDYNNGYVRDIFNLVNYDGSDNLLPFMEHIQTSSAEEYLKKNVSVIADNMHMLSIIPGYENKDKYTGIENINFLDNVYARYDITVVAITDESNKLNSGILNNSHFIIIPDTATKNNLLAIKDRMSFMKKKMDIPNEKVCFVAYDYKSGIHIKKSVLKYTVNNYLGAVSYLKNRDIYRSQDVDFDNVKKPFVKMFYNEVKHDYEPILKYFKIPIKLRILDRISYLANKYFNKEKVSDK
jgi:hypothetical protein